MLQESWAYEAIAEYVASKESKENALQDKIIHFQSEAALFNEQNYIL